MADTLFEIVKSGSLAHLDSALQKHGKDINKLTTWDAAPLHAAVWRNNLPIIARLLAAGADPNLQDGESGWSALHRALYAGHIAAAALLLQARVSCELADYKGRTSVDLVSAQLHRRSAVVAPPALPSGGSLEPVVFSWGSGANYQLGTGSTDFHEQPIRVDALMGMRVTLLAAGKFHSAAVTEDGVLYTWGWGRGGRLGHSDFHIHSGERAVLAPLAVNGLGRRQIVAVAAGKHHMLAATSAGELFSWGSNRYGALGYANIDTQPTPRKVGDFRHCIMAVAAANKHSTAITSAGEVFTWGSNAEGQLGYGTPNSANNPTPRLVEALKGKVITAISAAKRHTVVLTSEGDPYTWGYKSVTPRRVQLAGSRDVARACPPPGSQPEIRFHRGMSDVVRPVGVAIAAGFMHTSCLTATGVVLAWRSADPALKVEEVAGVLAGRHVTNVSAAKYRTLVCTAEGDLFMWESKVGKRSKTGAIDVSAIGPVVPLRIPGVKGINQVVVAEKHSLALQIWQRPPMPDQEGRLPEAVSAPVATGSASDSDVDLAEIPSPSSSGSDANTVDSLQVLCQRVVASQLVEPRTVLPVLEYADAAGALLLRSYSLATALHNLDVVLTEAAASLQSLPAHLLAELEQLYKSTYLLQSSPVDLSFQESMTQSVQGNEGTESASGSRTPLLGTSPPSFSMLASSLDIPPPTLSTPSTSAPDAAAGMSLQDAYRARARMSRLQPHLRPTAAPAWLRGAPAASSYYNSASNKTTAAAHVLGALGHYASVAPAGGVAASLSASEPAFTGLDASTADLATRTKRNILKKLQQIALLEEQAASGRQLDVQQLAKISQKAPLLEALHALEAGAPIDQVQQLTLHASEVASKLAGTASTDTAPTTPTGSKPHAAPFRGKKGNRVDANSPSALETASEFTPSASHATTPTDLQSRSTPSFPSLLTIAAQSPAVNMPIAAAAGGREALTGSAGKSRKPSQRKGDLTSFLQGELDKPVPPPVPVSTTPPAAASKGPAWGGAGALQSVPQAIPSIKELLQSSQTAGNSGSTQSPHAKALRPQSNSPLPQSGSASTPSPKPSKMFTHTSQGPRTPGDQQQSGASHTTSTPASAGSKGTTGSRSLTATPTGSLPESVHNQNTGSVSPMNSKQRQLPQASTSSVSYMQPHPRPGSTSAHTEATSSSSQSTSAASNSSHAAAVPVKLSLQEFMSGKLPPKQPVMDTREPSGPAWGATLGTSPPSGKSFKDIQAEQERTRAYMGPGRSSSGQVACPLGSSPPSRSSSLLGSSPPANKWYIPEQSQVRPQAMQAIQTEEAAIAELSKKYGGKVKVKVVPAGPP